ncbi:MAG: AAA family ATPase [Alphaproteobacteria bacterium]|nr:AAA family ATPase [Alphaproteobacteria bacterium]
MTHITIKNVGPVKDVKLDLNKVNVFMGPQSSGKSTIAKIISYCSWYEKNTILGTRPNVNFYKDLIDFHNLEDNYFSDDSLIEYKSPNCHIIFSGKKGVPVSVVTKVGPKRIFRNEKIEYIPAERNIVSVPGIGQYTESRNNVLNFLYDWFRAKRNKKEENKYTLPLTSLNCVSYYYVQDEDSDKLLLEDGKEIKLQHASSGLMSVTPLIMVFNYVIGEIYFERRTQSPFETINIESKIESLDLPDKEILKKLTSQTKVLNEAKEKLLKKKITSEQQAEINELMRSVNDLQKKIVNSLGFDSDYNYTKLIIEEPELNLFPEAQRDLMYYMLESLVKDKRDHQLVLTTHSPYILFALNNCMMGGLVKKNISPKERKTFASFKSWIDPKKVSIYEIHNGTLKCIQDEDGIIEDNYLNQAYKDNSSEYMSLLNYFDDDER